MPKLSQRGAIQFIIPLILLLGIIGVVYLVTKGPLKIFPKATVSGPVSPESSFTLVEVTQGPYAIGGTVGVAIYARSDITAANIFAAKLNFPTNLLEATVISHPATPIIVDDYIEKYINNATGEVSIVGTKASPGFQTAVGGSYDALAVITFKVKGIGNATFSITDESAIYSNSDNVNVLTVKRPLSIMIGGGVSQPITPSPTPSPTPFVCTACAADINSDGVVTILDFSSLAACFNKEATTSVGALSCSRADINRDGRVTLPDFNCLADKFNLSCRQGAESGGRGGMDQETRRSLEAQLEKAAVLPPPPVATPVPGTGDGNGDGKINLVDLSVLLSDFNKESGFRRGIDLNGDGKINTFDFSLMRNLLIQKGVIRG